MSGTLLYWIELVSAWKSSEKETH